MNTIKSWKVAGDSPGYRNPSAVIVLFGILLFCFIWSGLFYKIQAERQLELNGALKETAGFTRTFEEHTVRTIKGVDQALLSLKYQYEKEGQAFDIPRYVSEQRLLSQPVLQMTVVDENGELVASSYAPFVPANIRDREHFLVHKDVDEGKLFVSQPVLGRSSGKWSIQMSRRINKPDGSFAGVAVASVDPFYFSDFYKQVDLGENSAIALIGRDGIVRVRQDGQVANFGQDFTKSVVMEKLSSSNIGHFFTQSRVDGIKRIYAYRALADYPLVVVVGIDEEVVYQDLNNRIIGYYWAAGTSTFVIIIFIVTLLFIAARQKSTAQALKQARDGLSDKVEQRTRELFEANEKLKAMNEESSTMNRELQFTNMELENEIAERNRIESLLIFSEEELRRKNTQLAAALQDIRRVQGSLIQQEKLAGIGQLAAGVAHEINNPLGFITGNIEALEQYFNALSLVFAQYRELRADIAAGATMQSILARVDQIGKLEINQDLDYIFADIPDVFSDTSGGLSRMSKIVKGMRLFSRVDQQQIFEIYDLNMGLENTLLVAHTEIKHSAIVEQNFGQIPLIEAIGGEVNQVLLNLVFNAVYAIREKHRDQKGVIKLSTWHDEESVSFAVEDNGTGISMENINHIFNPFFTTKPVGQGTGMGLSISYEIIVNHHHGEIKVESRIGEGTTFIVRLPIKHDLLDTIKNSCDIDV